MLPELGGTLLVQHEVHMHFSELNIHHLRPFKHTDIQFSPPSFLSKPTLRIPALAEPPVYKSVPAWPSRVQPRADLPTAQLFEEALSDHPLVPPQTAPLLHAPPGMWVFVRQPYLPPLRPNCFLSSPRFWRLGKVFPVQALGRSLLARG